MLPKLKKSKLEKSERYVIMEDIDKKLSAAHKKGAENLSTIKK